MSTWSTDTCTVILLILEINLVCLVTWIFLFEFCSISLYSSKLNITSEDHKKEKLQENNCDENLQSNLFVLLFLVL